MELSTTGRTIYPGYQLHIVHQPQATLDNSQPITDRFRLVLIKHGTGLLHLGENRIPLVPPVLLCLDERAAAIRLTHPTELQAQAIYFHPAVINHALSFACLRTGIDHLPLTAQQDVYCLNPFLQRNENYDGLIMLGTTAMRHVETLMNTIGRELDTQRDDGWPCRSRSFLIELLFFVQRLHLFHQDTPQPLDITLPGDLTEIDPVILYLHTHYPEKVTIGSLSRQFHTNRTTLNERFRAVTGMSIMTYLAHLRIQIAAAILHDTTLPVFEVATRVGFKDTTHFGRIFRKHMDCTPSEYRERYCWML